MLSTFTPGQRRRRMPQAQLPGGILGQPTPAAPALSAAAAADSPGGGPERTAEAGYGPSPYPTFGPNPNGTFDLAGQGLKKGPKKIEKGMAQLQYGIGQSLVNPYLASIQQLIQQGQEGADPDAEARFLAPRVESLENSFTARQGELDRDLSARGIQRGSYGGAQYGGLAGEFAEAGADLYNTSLDQRQDRQDRINALIRDALSSAFGRSTSQAADVSAGINNRNLQQQLAEGQEGNFFEELLMGAAPALASRLRF